MYTSILVPLDGSQLAEQVLPYVRILARAFGAQIDLLRVVEPLPPAGLTDPAHEVYRQQAIIGLEQEARDYLENVAASLREEDFTVSTTVNDGTPLSHAATYIVAKGGEDPDRLIAMCSHGRSGIRRWVLGSVADKVLEATANPMLIVRVQQEPPSEVRMENVIVPLDGSPLAEQALPHASSMAQALGLRTILLRVTPSIEEEHDYKDSPALPGEEQLREIDDRALEYLHEVGRKLQQQGVPAVEEQLRHGDPAAGIVDLALEISNDLVAMTTHGRSGIARWLRGSVADRVVRFCGDPVLMIRATE